MNVKFKKLKQLKLAIGSFYVLVFLYVGAIFAGFLAPYHFAQENRELSYAPPSKIHVIDYFGKLCLPFVYSRSYKFDENYNRVYAEDTTRKCPIKFFVRGDEYQWFGLFKSNLHLFGVDKQA